MLKLELKTSGITACKHSLPPDLDFWSLLGAERTMEVTGDQKSSCHGCSAFTGMGIKQLPRGTYLQCTRGNNDIMQPSR